MDRIITYSFEENFIENVVSFVEENYIKQNKDISKLAFVFGGKRPSLFLKKELAKRIKGSFFSPKFFSIDEFIEYILSKKNSFTKISDLESCFIIYNLAKDIAPDILNGKENFPQFLPWAYEVLSFIELLDLEDVKSDILKQVQHSAKIGYDVPENINTLLQNVSLIRDKYHNILKNNKNYSRGLIYNLSAQYVNDIDFNEFDEILFCNFFYLHKTEEKILKNIYNKNKAILLFQGDEDEWPILKNISKNFLCKMTQSVIPECFYRESKKRFLNAKYTLKIYAGFGVHSQVALTGEILKKIKNMDKTVIMLPKADNLIPLLSEISSHIDEFNVSLGYPLSRSSLYSLFKYLFQAQNTKKKDKYYTKDYLKVLNHPFSKSLKLVCDSSVTRVLVHKIEEFILGIEESLFSGSVFIDPKEIENFEKLYDITANTLIKMNIEISAEELKNTLKELHNILFYSWEDIKTFYNFSLNLERFLNVLIETCSFLSIGSWNDFQLKIIEQTFVINEELKNLSFSKELFLKDEIFKIFEERLASDLISFTGSPVKGLQILGLFETRSLNFENVIVMDMNEGVLPKLKNYEPLIPREIMLMLNLDRYEKEEEIQRYQFMRLISSAKNVHLIYDEGKDKEKSRFIEELIWNNQKASNSLDVLPVSRANFNVEILPEKTDIKKSKDVLNLLKDFEYSPTSLNTYVNCPLRFYYAYVLRLKEKEDLLDEPEGADIGNFVHNLFENTFKGFIGKKPYIDEKFKIHFFSEFDNDFKEKFEKRMKSDAFLLKEILFFRLNKFLAYETRRDVKEIIGIEQQFREKIKLNDNSYMFNCRIDRIDKLEDGSILIIDYKTGSEISKPKTIDKLESMKEFTRTSIKDSIKSFQLPIYFYLVEKLHSDAVVNAAFYSLRTISLNYLYDKDKTDYPEYRSKFTNLLIKSLDCVISEISNPESPFKADDSNTRYCEHCPYFYLCR